MSSEHPPELINGRNLQPTAVLWYRKDARSMLKILIWIVVIIFLVGLLVVSGLLKLIF